MAITYHAGRRIQGTNATATGGSITTVGTKTIHTFTEDGNFTANGDFDVEYLVIAGGGGGGGGLGGGGGAGGYRTATGFGVTGQTYAITVGAGGAGAVANASKGSDSVFSTITSEGGGLGTGEAGGNGGNGGSGGGTGTNGGSGGTATSGQGFNGGASSANAKSGGGGAGAVGNPQASGNIGGNGGVGLSSSITGSAVTRAGGGGGASWSSSTNSSGGTGGGGAGSQNAGTAGTVNTGSGGGGGGESGSNQTGGAGGSGIVIIAYETVSPLDVVDNSVASTSTVTQSLTNERVGNTAGGNPTGQVFKSGSELIGKNVYEVTLYQYYTGTLNADGLMTVGWYSETDDSLIEAWLVVDPSTTLTLTEAAITYTGNHIVQADEVFGWKFTNTGGGVIRNSSQNTDVYDGTNSYYSEAGTAITGRDLKFTLKYGDLVTTRNYTPQISIDGNYTVLKYNQNGKFVPTSDFDVEYLVVAGGGSGAVNNGGGGAGGYRTATGFGVTSGIYGITVGAGGEGSGYTGNRGNSGVNSVFSTITSTGGGGGGCESSGQIIGGNGGSGGGGGYPSGTAGGISSPVTSPVQGYAGGTSGNQQVGGGGGGSSAVGSNASGYNAGNGGNGTANSISGSSVTYSGGGGGGAGTASGVGSSGGSGGGGSGSASNGIGGTGTPNSGSGGGGSADGSGTSGSGGSGVVILRFLTSGNTYTTKFLGNTQVGSRYEETNTRKIYHKDDIGFKEENGNEATNYTSASWYEQLSGETP